MGKRKKASKPMGPKKRELLATTFQCLFCNHENSVSVKLQKKEGTGHLSCKVCGQTFQTGINYLSAAVDVYSDWIDACDSVAQPQTTGSAAKVGPRSTNGPSARAGQTAAGTAGEEEEGILEGFIDDDEADMEAQYDDE